MTLSPPPSSLPGRAIPYVLRQGEGLTTLVAGQVIRTLAGDAETAGRFGVVVSGTPLDPRPIPMHWHAREHDTWLCLRGKMQVWCKEQSRVLAPGDFAYVAPGEAHSYQSRAVRSEFFGIVAPGGWEEFFVDAGEPWASDAVPPPDRPFDVSRMGPAMRKHAIMPVPDAVYVDATPMGEADRSLPGHPSSFFLEAGSGDRHLLLGHLVTALLTSVESGSMLDMHVLEAGRGAAIPPHRHAETHEFVYLLDGRLAVTLDGVTHRLSAGDAASIPTSCLHGTRVDSGRARWVSATAGGNGGALYSHAGEPTAAFDFPFADDQYGALDRLPEACRDIDVDFGSC